MKSEVFYDTDVLASYLAHRGQQPSVLRILSRHAFGMTSVLQASELLAAATPAELSRVESVFHAVRVLGFHARYAAEFGELHRRAGPGTRMRDSMTAGFCLINRVPLVTSRVDAFRRYHGLGIIDPVSVHADMTRNEMAGLCVIGLDDGSGTPCGRPREGNSRLMRDVPHEPVQDA